MSKLTCMRTAKKENDSYEDFLKSRLLGFGGSDIGDLLDSEPYGCKRRLFLERLGLMPATNDDKRAHHLERGKFFEAPVAELYQKRTGREVKETGTGYLKQYPFVRANADRLVYGPAKIGEKGRSSCGVLEIKVPAAWSFKKIKKEGLPEAYILQLQWQMLCYGTTWGSFCVYWPDGHEMLWFDIERDDALIQMLFDRAKGEWELLEFYKIPCTDSRGWTADAQFPPTKPSHYTGCQNCPAYEKCHGMALPDGVILAVPELEPVAARYSELVGILKGNEKEKDELKSQLKDAFVKFPCERIDAGRFQIAVREQSKETVSSDVKKELTPAQAVRYVKQTQFEVLTVKEARK